MNIFHFLVKTSELPETKSFFKLIVALENAKKIRRYRNFTECFKKLLILGDFFDDGYFCFDSNYFKTRNKKELRLFATIVT